MTKRLCIAAVLFLAWSSSAHAQSFEVGAHVATAKWSEFGDVDAGVGGRLTWKPVPLIGVDAELTWYPGDQLGAFSRRRFEGLFGVTVGPKINRVRPFAKASAGFVDVTGTTGAFACIAIFPPPLACALAGGDTLPAFEIGGGIEVDITRRTFFRADVSSRFLKYPGPTFDSEGDVRLDGFFGQAIRFTFGGGFRF
jgi:hypothetical protein